MLNATLDISRGREADTSAEAFANSLHSRIFDTAKIMQLFHDFKDGLTLKDIATMMSKEKNAISGRITELRAGGFIFDTGVRRDGCRVYKLT